jgi:hypothetical protein
MRFAYSRLGTGDASVLAGYVYVDTLGQIETEAMNGRIQH